MPTTDVDAPPHGLEGPSDDAAPTPAPPRPPRALRFFALVLLLFVFPGQLAQAANPVAGLAWSEACGLLLPALVAAAGANLRPAAALLLARRPTRAQVGLGAAMGLAAFLVAVPLAGLWTGVLPERVLRRFDLSPLFDQPPLVRGALAVVAATVAPFCEEAAFRGYVLSALRARREPAAAIAIAAALFALMHLDPVRFPQLLVLGAVFGWLAWRAGSLWPAVVAHAVNNGVVAVAAVLGDGGGPATERADPKQALALLVPGLALLLGVASAYRNATPAPPPAGEALARRDPADTDPRWDARRLGPGLRRAVATAVVALCVLLAAGLLLRARP